MLDWDQMVQWSCCVWGMAGARSSYMGLGWGVPRRGSSFRFWLCGLLVKSSATSESVPGSQTRLNSPQRLPDDESPILTMGVGDAGWMKNYCSGRTGSLSVLNVLDLTTLRTHVPGCLWGAMNKENRQLVTDWLNEIDICLIKFVNLRSWNRREK